MLLIYETFVPARASSVEICNNLMCTSRRYTAHTSTAHTTSRHYDYVRLQRSSLTTIINSKNLVEYDRTVFISGALMYKWNWSSMSTWNGSTAAQRSILAFKRIITNRKKRDAEKLLKQRTFLHVVVHYKMLGYFTSFQPVNYHTHCKYHETYTI